MQQQTLEELGTVKWVGLGSQGAGNFALTAAPQHSDALSKFSVPSACLPSSADIVSF